MDVTWLLLIYTVAAEPSRKRAAIWRELNPPAHDRDRRTVPRRSRPPALLSAGLDRCEGALGTFLEAAAAYEHSPS